MLRQGDGGAVVPMRVPGDGHSALHAAGVIPDPYAGRNERAVRWVGEADWTLTREVAVPEGAELVIDGLDCVAEVRFRGRMLGRLANAFRRHVMPIPAGEGTLEIAFRSAVKAAAEAAEGLRYPVPNSKNNPIPHGNLLRKPACDFGWDWGICLTPFGITGGIRLREAREGRIAGIAVEQRLTDAGMAVALKVLGGIEGEPIRAALCGAEATGMADRDGARLTLTVPDPDLWWPAGHGGQPLHELTVSAGDETATRTLGLREVRLISEPDAIGRSFKLNVNGRDVFCRGANWIPADALAGWIDAERGRDLLRSAHAANMNMIRVWGGGRYEADWFYRECDRLGLMVWQDAMLACNLYPADDAFLAEIRAEVAEQALRLSHHPSLALWCGDNELVGSLLWYPEALENRDRYLVAYDRLNRAVEAGVRTHLSDPNWWPSSPSPGPMEFGDTWHQDGRGDMHFWSVWHENREFAHYRDVRPRFCSEFGFQSYPSMPVIRRFAAPKDLNVASPVMQSHQKDEGGNERIAATMFREFLFPEAFEDFVWLSQVQQALAIETAISAWRPLKPECMGTLYWQLNDVWPGPSWSSLDHGGSWKLLHHAARRFYAPVCVLCRPEGGALVLHGVNDGPGPARIGFEAFAVDAAGAERPLGAQDVTLITDAAIEIDRPEVGPGEVLLWRWSGDADGWGLHSPVPWKELPIRDPGLRLEVRGTDLTLTSDALALFATVEADVPGRFGDNMVPVTPGRPVRLTFRPDDPSARPNYRLRDLHGATHPKGTT
ncbi:MAG: beta-mannosidase [Hasllibacter sp.]